MADPTPAEIMAAMTRIEAHLDERRRPNGDVMAAVAKLEARVDQRFAEMTVELNRRFDAQRFVGQDVWQQQVRAVERRLDDLDGDVQRAQDRLATNARMVLASLIFPVLVAIVVAALLTTGGT